MDRDELSTAYMRRRPLLRELSSTLEASTQDALVEVKHVDRITFRVKALKSFIEKALKLETPEAKPCETAPEPRLKYSAPLVELEDQIAGRVITFFRDDLPIVREQLVGRFGAVEHVVKEPTGPEEFGYESEHFVFVIPEHLKPSGWNAEEDMPNTFEFQVRTLFMHAWAEPQHDLGYKGSDVDRETKRELAWIAASAWGADRTLSEVARRLNASV